MSRSLTAALAADDIESSTANLIRLGFGHQNTERLVVLCPPGETLIGRKSVRQRKSDSRKNSHARGTHDMDFDIDDKLYVIASERAVKSYL